LNKSLHAFSKEKSEVRFSTNGTVTAKLSKNVLFFIYTNAKLLKIIHIRTRKKRIFFRIPFPKCKKAINEN